jgi:predicted ArsR family transcriptional regulator
MSARNPNGIAGRILAALADGPGVAMDIALELGMDSRHVGVHLRYLWTQGRVRRERFMAERGPLWMYHVIDTSVSPR